MAVNSTNMSIAYREGNIDDVNGLRELAIKSWAQYRSKLTNENWIRLSNKLNDAKTYVELIEKSKSIIRTSGNKCPSKRRALVGTDIACGGEKIGKVLVSRRRWDFHEINIKGPVGCRTFQYLFLHEFNAILFLITRILLYVG